MVTPVSYNPDPYSLMRLAAHGGYCCGIKTIHGLGESPDGLISKKEPHKYVFTLHAADKFGCTPHGDINMFTAGAPEETEGSRFERVLAHLKDIRPAGVCEVVTVDSGDTDNGWFTATTDKWGGFLVSLGFNKVTSAKNSNSGNTIDIWHLVYDEGGWEDDDDDDYYYDQDEE